MSEDHAPVEQVRHDAGPEHHHHHEPHEHAPAAASEPWVARVLFGFAGLVLLAGAVAAWQFKSMFGGEVGEALPWIIAAAVLLGGAAILESISTSVWIALIAGIFLLAITYVIAGRVATYPSVGQSIFVVDRFTGEVELCNSEACTVLPRRGNLFYPLPKLPKVPTITK
jgi:hypothetical protein